jgi:Family of unknown function (DUF5946)
VSTSSEQLSPAELAACPGCAAPVGNSGPCDHPYIAASAECWELFGMLQTMETERWGYPQVHRLAVDAYAAQHPGDGKDRRDRQSVFVHLASICCVLERGAPAREAIGVLRRMSRDAKREYPALCRSGPGALDLRHAWDATDLADYERRCRAWARAVWDAYAPSQAAVRGQLDSLTAR